jgi:hypothetical protein
MRRRGSLIIFKQDVSLTQIQQALESIKDLLDLEDPVTVTGASRNNEHIRTEVYVCAWCLREFVAAHGKPVYCQQCYDNAFATRKSFSLLPKAWLSLKADS